MDKQEKSLKEFELFLFKAHPQLFLFQKYFQQRLPEKKFELFLLARCFQSKPPKNTHIETNSFKKDNKTGLYLPQKKSWLLKNYSLFSEKTIWDWLELIVAPVLIAIIAGAFTLNANKNTNNILTQRHDAEIDRNQQALLNEYLKETSRLIEQKLLTSNKDYKTQRIIAHARTLTLLKTLDSNRKGELIQFFISTGLLELSNPIIDLNRADLTETDFENESLAKVNLSGANFKKANFKGADLTESKFNGFREGNTEFVSQTQFNEANLSGADFSGADLTSVTFRGADFTNADLTNAKSLTVKRNGLTDP